MATWGHPATKTAHMIDYVFMHAGQHVMCTDVQVMKRASCWTDHYLVRIKLRLGLAQWKSYTPRLLLAVHVLASRDKRCLRA